MPLPEGELVARDLDRLALALEIASPVNGRVHVAPLEQCGGVAELLVRSRPRNRGPIRVQPLERLVGSGQDNDEAPVQAAGVAVDVRRRSRDEPR